MRSAGGNEPSWTGHTSDVGAVAVAPNSSWLASGSWDGTVRIWDAVSGRQRAVLKGHTSDVGAVAVAPDSRWLASGSWDGTVRIWDAVSGRQRAVLKGHTSDVGAVAVAPDGSWLASGSSDGTVRIWDVDTGRQRAVLEGHASDVDAVAVALDGRWLASGSTDGTVRIWDVAIGLVRVVPEGHLRRGACGGGGARWQLAGLRKHGSNGPDLGRQYRTRTSRPGQATPARCMRWRWRRMAAGWPPEAGIRRCGSGTRTLGRNGPC